MYCVVHVKIKEDTLHAEFPTTMKINPEYSEQGKSRLKVGKHLKRSVPGMAKILSGEGVLPWQQKRLLSVLSM